MPGTIDFTGDAGRGRILACNHVRASLQIRN
ncbi:hypothetical protein FBY31_2160 [Arthrobacter sp. SLBN-100]|nr:hypothetical protein FBY31_2160 [Arthrobacter sp. SLBN-100]